MKKLMLLCTLLFMGSAVSAASRESSTKVSSIDFGDDHSECCGFSISVQKASFDSDLHVWMREQGSRGILGLMGHTISAANMVSAITGSFLKEKRADEEEQLLLDRLPVRSKEHFSSFVNCFVRRFEKQCLGIRCEVEGADDTYIGLGEKFSLPDRCKKVIIIFEYNVEVVQSLGGCLSSMLDEHFFAKVIASEKVSEEALKSCGFCNASDKAVFLCSGCLKKAYCSKECQRSDWKTGHKEWCKANPAQEKK